MTTRADDSGPFHEGELALQRATGERDAGAGNGRIIVDRVIPQAFGFIARQELAVMATIDGDGRPWCSALVGPPGSFTVADPTRCTYSIGNPVSGSGETNTSNDPSRESAMWLAFVPSGSGIANCMRAVGIGRRAIHHVTAATAMRARAATSHISLGVLPGELGLARAAPVSAPENALRAKERSRAD